MSVVYSIHIQGWIMNCIIFQNCQICFEDNWVTAWNHIKMTTFQVIIQDSVPYKDTFSITTLTEGPNLMKLFMNVRDLFCCSIVPSILSLTISWFIPWKHQYLLWLRHFRKEKEKRPLLYCHSCIQIVQKYCFNRCNLSFSFLFLIRKVRNTI